MMEKGRGVENSYIPSRTEREVNEFKKLNREKSFDEARTAVQSQIEKIFQKVRLKIILVHVNGIFIRPMLAVVAMRESQVG